MLCASATPPSQRPRAASAPKVKVVTSPSRTRPSASPSKRDAAARPQAVQAVPVPFASAPPRDSRNELPSSSSRSLRLRVSRRAAASSPPPSPQRAQAVPRSPPAPSPEIRSANAAKVSAAAALSRVSPPAAPPEDGPLPAPPATPSTGIRCPPSVTCEPPPGEPVSRSVTASTTWSATVRPKRASHACGIGSEFSIVPVASPSRIRAPDAFESVSVSVSPSSSWASSSTGTFTVFAVSPGAKVSMPLAAV